MTVTIKEMAEGAKNIPAPSMEEIMSAVDLGTHLALKVDPHGHVFLCDADREQLKRIESKLDTLLASDAAARAEFDRQAGVRALTAELAEDPDVRAMFIAGRDAARQALGK